MTRASTIKVLAVYWALLAFGITMYTGIRSDALEVLAPVWLGTFVGTVVGQVLALRSARGWFLLLVIVGGGMLWIPQLPDTIASLIRDYGARANAPGSVSLSERESRMPSSGMMSASPSPAAVSSRRGPPTEAALRELLMRHRGNIAAVGRELGKERMQVHRWMKRYSIRVEEYRD